MVTIKIIISPAKKMIIDNDTIHHRQMPALLEETDLLLGYLKKLSYEDLKSIWKCSDKLAKANFDRIKHMDLYKNLTPGILSFQGLQYQYMGSGVFSDDQLDYLERHLRILSGFYGVLRPFDGIVPYRLEMQSNLLGWKYNTMYEFWGDRIAKNILSESDCIVNLASKEYSRSISKYLPQGVSFITCVFGELVDGKVVEKGTLAKMARGEMVRFMAENKFEEVEEIKDFDRLNYTFKIDLSDESNYVFIKRP